jgi:hypothetical protein
MKKIALAILAVVSLVASFAAGGHLTRRHIMGELDEALYETQAMLWFNHLGDYKEIESDLLRGCHREALEKTRIAIDQEMRLLAEFHAKHPSSSLNKYISDRDPKLLEQLREFKSKYGNSWKVPKCAK